MDVKFLADGSPVVVIEAGTDGPPYAENGAATPGWTPARVATFASVEDVEQAQLHDTPPAPPVEPGAQDTADLERQVQELRAQLDTLAAGGSGGNTAPGPSGT